MALIQAVGFIAVTYCYLYALSFFPPNDSITPSEALGAVLLTPLIVPFVAVLFLPIAWFRATRSYGQSNPLALFYGAAFGILLFSVNWLLVHLVPTVLSQPAPGITAWVFLVAAAVILPELILLKTEDREV